MKDEMYVKEYLIVYQEWTNRRLLCEILELC